MSEDLKVKWLLIKIRIILVTVHGVYCQPSEVTGYLCPFQRSEAKTGGSAEWRREKEPVGAKFQACPPGPWILTEDSILSHRSRGKFRENTLNNQELLTNQRSLLKMYRVLFVRVI